MRILLVHGNKLNFFPPVRNLVEILLRNNHEVVLVTRCDGDLAIEASDNLKYIKIPNHNTSKALFAFSYLNKKMLLRRIVKEEMKNCDLLWTTTDTTVRDLGDLVYNYKHVLQLMELIEYVPLVPNTEIKSYKIRKYAQKAFKVVVPEYNRAHIQKVFWDLKQLPTVLPNKMSLLENKDIPEGVNEVLKELDNEKRKIILYQGGFASDRNLDAVAEAIETLSHEYCLYIMGYDSKYRRDFSEKYPKVKYIGFINPPYHLCITEKAYIGLLPYVAMKCRHHSILNAVYCAPNKIFEYSSKKLPMLGSNLPGLSVPFQKYDIGYTYEDDLHDIVSKIKKIESRYEEIQENCLKFYNSVDMDKIVNRILL